MSKKQKNYGIVSFTNEPGVISLIPSIWLSEDKKVCFWPPFPAGNAIKNCKKPSDNWSQVHVDVIEENIECYDKGLRHEQRAVEDLKLQTTDTEAPISRLRTRHSTPAKSKKVTKRSPSLALAGPTSFEAQQSSSESSEAESYHPVDDDNDLLKRLDALRNDGGRVNNDQSIPVSTVQQEDGYFVSQSNVDFIVDKLTSLEQKQTAFQKTVLTQIAGIRSDVAEILTWAKSKDFKGHQNLCEKIPFVLPMTSAQEITDIENWLTAETNRKQLVILCSSFGGSDIGKVVRRILSKLFSPELSRNINYIGANGKIEFRTLTLKEIVSDAARLTEGNQTVTDSKIEDIIKRYFQNTRDLDGGRTARKETSKNVVVPK